MKKKSWFKKFEGVEELLYRAVDFEDLERIERVRERVLSFAERNVWGGRALAAAHGGRDWEIRKRRIKAKLFEKIEEKESRLQWQWGRSVFAVVSVILVFGVSFFSPFGISYLQASKLSFVEEVEGNVSVVRNGKKIEVTEGFGLRSGDVLETGKESLAKVRFADDSIGKLGENTVLRVTEEKAKKGSLKIKAKLEKGELVAKVSNEVLGSGLVVEVEESKFSLNNMSEFVVSKENENVIVKVLGNEVSVTSEEGKVDGNLYTGLSEEILKESDVVEGNFVVVEPVYGEKLVGFEKWSGVLDGIEVLDGGIEKKEKLRGMIKEFSDIIGKYGKDELSLIEKRLMVSDLFDWRIEFEKLFDEFKNGSLDSLGGEGLRKFMVTFVEEELMKLKKVVPIDNLYNVRLSLEQIYLVLVSDDVKKVLDGEYAFYNQRLEEVNRLLSRGKGNVAERIFSDLILKNAELNVKENFVLAEGRIDKSFLLRIYDAMASFSMIENSNYVRNDTGLSKVVENLKRNRLEYLLRYYKEIGVENVDYAEVLKFRNVVVSLNLFDGMENDLVKVAREIFVRTSERGNGKVVGIDELEEGGLLMESTATPERSVRIGQ